MRSSSPGSRRRSSDSSLKVDLLFFDATSTYFETGDADEPVAPRLAEIEDDIEQAHALGDAQRAAQADAERGFLMRELAHAFGLSGRARRAAPAASGSLRPGCDISGRPTRLNSAFVSRPVWIMARAQLESRPLWIDLWIFTSAEWIPRPVLPTWDSLRSRGHGRATAAARRGYR